jgi:hypothetical protein
METSKSITQYFHYQATILLSNIQHSSVFGVVVFPVQKWLRQTNISRVRSEHAAEETNSASGRVVDVIIARLAHRRHQPLLSCRLARQQKVSATNVIQSLLHMQSVARLENFCIRTSGFEWIRERPFVLSSRQGIVDISQNLL